VRTDLQNSQNILIDALFPEKLGKNPKRNPSPGGPQ